MNTLAVNLLLGTLVFWAIARLYLIPRLPHLEPRTIVIPILLLHATRHLGLMFLAPGATYPGLPPRFAYPAAIGDLLAAILALLALPVVVRRARAAKALVWLFNVEGSIDLLAAIVLATVLDAGPTMGAAYWIPALWVPALLVSHYLLFRLLLRPWPGAAEVVQGGGRYRDVGQVSRDPPYQSDSACHSTSDRALFFPRRSAGCFDGWS